VKENEKGGNLDDPGIGGLYLARVKQRLSTLYYSLWRRNVMRSGLVTGFLLGCVLVGLTFVYRQHMSGNFHKLKQKMADERVDAPVPRPGGQEAVTLTRTRLMGDATPEFLSVTMLPGRGMNVLQITAWVPGRGEVNLMASPTVEGAAKAMTGMGEDADGYASLTMGGAFEAPWAGRIWGTPARSGHIAATWQGRTITLPAAGGGENAVARDGLMLAEASDSLRTAALPDGGNAEVVFHAGDFAGQWPSKTDVTIVVLLGSHTIDLNITARNTGEEPEPVGVGWDPLFAISDGDRQQLRLRIPSEMRVETRGHDKVPTGALLPVEGTPYDFMARGGGRLGTMDLDEYFVELRQNLMDNGPIAELSDPAGNYGLRLTALSSTIKAMRVFAPANANFVSIQPQFNYPDPFGREWRSQTDTGMAVLQPGQSTQWKVRLELFSPAGEQPPM
jgi:galactose mutarotase-like enzyme